MELRRRAVLPRLGPRPPGMWPVHCALLLSAWLLLWPASRTPWERLPGDQLSPDASHALNNHWVVRARGLLGATNNRMTAYPVGQDRVVSAGFPLDVLASWPLVSTLGWPTGFSLYLVLLLWGSGVSMAWLAGRWWRSAWAAAVAGVAYQSSGVLLLECSRGCYNNLAGAVFVPLGLGLLARAVIQRRQRDALLAGAAAGLAALCYWFLGFYLVLGMVVLGLLALVERRFPWRVYLAALVGLALVVGLPLIYAAVTLAEVPGHDIGKWDMILVGSTERSLVRWIAETNTLVAPGQSGLRAIRPLLWLCALLGLWGCRSRRWAAPAIWILLGLALAMGPWIALPGGLLLPGPLLGLMDAPLLRRLWWPYRALLLAAPALALLAGGGAARLQRALPRIQQLARALFAKLEQMEVQHAVQRRWTMRLLPHAGILLAALLLAEAFLTHPLLPLPHAAAVAPATARELARGEGPVLELPFGNTPMRRDTTMFAEQRFHGRPLINSPIFPHASLATKRLRSSPTWTALDYLGLCEVNPRAEGHRKNLKGAIAGLDRVGLKQVHVKIAVVQAWAGRRTYLSCIEKMLGSKYVTSGPYRVYPVKR